MYPAAEPVIPGGRDAGASAGFARIGGHPALDFTNTVRWTADGPVDEQWTTFAELAAWGEAAGIVPAPRCMELVAEAIAHPATATAALAEARAVRVTVHQLLTTVATQSIDVDALRLFNHALSKAMQSLDLVVLDGRFTWRAQDGAALGTITAQALRSTAELLVLPNLAKVRCCANDHCGWLFLDTSRNGRRRWCSMDRCGGRAKARRYYHRTRDGRGGPANNGGSTTGGVVRRQEPEGDATGSP